MPNCVQMLSQLGPARGCPVLADSQALLLGHSPNHAALKGLETNGSDLGPFPFKGLDVFSSCRLMPLSDLGPFRTRHCPRGRVKLLTGLWGLLRLNYNLYSVPRHHAFIKTQGSTATHPPRVKITISFHAVLSSWSARETFLLTSERPALVAPEEGFTLFSVSVAAPSCILSHPLTALVKPGPGYQ